MSIKEILNKDIVQRIVYGIAAILWVTILWERVDDSPYSTSFLGISYLNVFIYPALLLIIQVLRNNRILWAIIVGLLGASTLASIFFVVADILERTGGPKAIDWNLTAVITMLLLIVMLFIANWLVYKIKPKRLF